MILYVIWIYTVVVQQYEVVSYMILLQYVRSSILNEIWVFALILLLYF